MSLLTPGYFPSNFYPGNYFIDNYWPNFGSVTAAGIVETISLKTNIEKTRNIITNMTLNTNMKTNIEKTRSLKTVLNG